MKLDSIRNSVNVFFKWETILFSGEMGDDRQVSQEPAAETTIRHIGGWDPIIIIIIPTVISNPQKVIKFKNFQLKFFPSAIHTLWALASSFLTDRREYLKTSSAFTGDIKGSLYF